MPNVVLHREGAVASLRIDRADKMNALDRATLEELRGAVEELARMPSPVVTISSAGDRVFVAGADIEAMSKMGLEEARRFSELGHATFDALEALPSVVVAVVQGPALGGGCELALACDLVLAGDRARFGQPETNLGLIPGLGGCSRLLRARSGFRESGATRLRERTGTATTRIQVRACRSGGARRRRGWSWRRRRKA